MAQNIDLVGIFEQVTQDLVKNQQALNQADDYNQDHGDNMVRTFRTISKSLKMKSKQGSSESTALAYAAKRLSKNSSSASAQLYAQGLAQAATRFKGKEVDPRGAMELLQTLIGGGGAAAQSSGAAPGGDLLGSLLGGMAGGSQAQSTTPQGGDLLGSLLGGMMGGGEAQSQQSAAAPGGGLLGALLGGMGGGSSSGSGLQNGLDLGDLLTVGLAFMQFKQQGKSTLEALVAAFMQMSGMGNSKDRAQSTELVVSSFLQALGTAQ